MANLGFTILDRLHVFCTRKVFAKILDKFRYKIDTYSGQDTPQFLKCNIQWIMEQSTEDRKPVNNTTK